MENSIFDLYWFPGNFPYWCGGLGDHWSRLYTFTYQSTDVEGPPNLHGLMAQSCVS